MSSTLRVKVAGEHDMGSVVYIQKSQQSELECAVSRHGVMTLEISLNTECLDTKGDDIVTPDFFKITQKILLFAPNKH